MHRQEINAGKPLPRQPFFEFFLPAGYKKQ
jgi:hypothetical protein